ncbi:MAG: adenylate/guanylate cyclase domain-containing protein [Stellaceae bacterium]
MPSFRQLPDRVRLILWFTAAAAVVGGAYGHLSAVLAGAPLFGLASVIRGAFVGAFIASVVGTVETLIATRAWVAPLRNASLAVHLAIKTMILLAVTLSGLVLGAWLLPAPGEVSQWLPVERRDVAFCLAASFVFNFLLEVNQLLGRNVLLNFITGRYHQPRLEERVFLFIDMVGSTGIAERLGELAFLRLLNRFVADLTAPILAARGEIHRYVGDELIATWKLADGVAEARCVRACFAALDRLARAAPAYQREFGVTISFRAGLHCGPVVTGEMGTVKKEIVFLGDTVNTTARIQGLCRETGDPVLASATLLDRLALPPGIAKRPLGERRLRGKESDIALYALERAAGARAAAA